jgi:hypothetical protein
VLERNYILLKPAVIRNFLQTYNFLTFILIVFLLKNLRSTKEFEMESRGLLADYISSDNLTAAPFRLLLIHQVYIGSWTLHKCEAHINVCFIGFHSNLLETLNRSTGREERNIVNMTS